MHFHFFIPIVNLLIDKSDLFADNLELTIDEVANRNPFVIVLLGDFNVKSENWYKHDKTLYKRAKIEAISKQFELQQFIKESNHILREYSSCTDLIFMSHQNLVMELGVHLSLHPNCHHQITSGKFNLKIHYPPPYERKYGIMTKQMLITLEKQLICFHEKKKKRGSNKSQHK